ncbi:MAG TPA: hypothetical protein VI112_06580 [Bacteroidia bacterium]|jgi:hypothetical protein
MLKRFFRTLVNPHSRVLRRSSAGVQPGWGIAFDRNTRYYYFPEIETYYDVFNTCFVHWNGREWKRSGELPSCYRWFDVYRDHKVALGNEREEPWKFHLVYTLKYPKNKWQSLRASTPRKTENETRGY